MPTPPRQTRTNRLVRPTLRGTLFLIVGAAVFVGAWAGDQRDLLFVGGLLLLIPIIAVAYVLVHPVRVSVARAFRPASVPAGQSATVTLQVRNLSAAPLVGLRWRDTAAGRLHLPPTQALRPLGARRGQRPTTVDTAILSYPVSSLRRGVYRVGPLMLGRADPFGLAYSEWPVGDPHDLTVTPKVTALPGSGVSITRGEGSRHERLRHLNNDSDEPIAREYRQGDPMRRVNWPATARHGQIMVRQEEQRSHPEARLVLDTSRSGSRSADRAPVNEFERAIELAASIGRHLLANGFRVDAVELGPSQLSVGPTTSGAVPGRTDADPDEGRLGGLHGDDPASFTGPEGALALLDALAQLTPRDRAHGDADAGGGSAAAGRHRPRRSGDRPVLAFGSQIPTFAVLVDTTDADTDDLAALRGLCQPAVAFVFDTMSATAVDRLADAGWQCVPLSARSDLADVWENAGQDRGDRVGQA